MAPLHACQRRHGTKYSDMVIPAITERLDRYILIILMIL
jgi:hypothetical protein